MTKLYSIIIVNYNTSQVTLNCIHSVLKFTHNLKDGELIVVDNGSDDTSVSEISKINNKHLKLIPAGENLGFSSGNNLGASQAKGRYLFFLNSDTLLLSNDLVKNINFLENHPEIGLLAPRLLNQDHSVQPSCLANQSIVNALKYLMGNKSSVGKYIPSQNIVRYVVGAAILIDRDFFNQIGGWNKKYFMYYEDLDLCDKVRLHHKQIFYKPDWQIVHLHGQSGLSTPKPSNSYKYLVESSKKYHGLIKHTLLTIIFKISSRL